MGDAGDESLIGARFAGGRYEVVAPLGAGGMGAVYRARDTAGGGDVALKVLHARLAAEQTHLARFRREAEVASALAHPNVVRVFDHGAEADGTPWMIMELLTGESLAKVGGRDAPMDPARAVRIVRRIAYGLAAVHGVGVVHRDLKPGNVMVAGAGTTDEIKVVDFGLARFFGSKAFERLTFTGQVVGTPGYMAPEQAFGGAVDERTDVYALGAILCALLTGQPPYGRGGFEQMLSRLVRGDRPPLPLSHPHLGPVAEVAERCLSVDPAGRYGSMAELDAALAALDPSPTTTLVDWAPPAGLEALRLAPDPVLDAVPDVAQTAFLRAARGRGGESGDAPAAAAWPSSAVAGSPKSGAVGAAPDAPALAPGAAGGRRSAPARRSGRAMVLVGVALALVIAVGVGVAVVSSIDDPIPDREPVAVGGPGDFAAVPAVTPIALAERLAAAPNAPAAARDAGAATEGSGGPAPAESSSSSRGMRASRPSSSPMGGPRDSASVPESLGTSSPAVTEPSESPPGPGRRRMTLEIRSAGAWTEGELRQAFAPGLRRGNSCLAALPAGVGRAEWDGVQYWFTSTGAVQGLAMIHSSGGISPELRACTDAATVGLRVPARQAPRAEMSADFLIHFSAAGAP